MKLSKNAVTAHTLFDTFEFIHCPPMDLPDLTTTNLDGKRLYVLPDGSHLPSVTTVLGAVKSKNHLNEWKDRIGHAQAEKICTQASNRGNRLHSLAEEYIKNNPNYFRGVFPDVKELFNSIKPILNKSLDNVMYQEQALYSKTIGLAGRVDCIGHWDGKLSIIDFKNSLKTKKKEWIGSYFMQECAYALMFQEMTGIPVKQLVTLIAVVDGPPQVFLEKTSDHVEDLSKAIKKYQKMIKIA